MGNWPWCSKEENGLADKRFRFTLTSLSNPRRCIGFGRRRMGRGGRVILDRINTNYDDLWRRLDFSIVEPSKSDISGVVKMETSFINNGSNSNSNTNFNNNIRTDIIKSEFSDDLRTSTVVSSDDTTLAVYGDIGGQIIQIKKEEPEEVGGRNIMMDTSTTYSNKNGDEAEMVEILRSVQRDL